MIEIKGLTKHFGHKQVLDNVTVTFEDGEVVGIIGPSGTGKTTMIKCMLGMEKIDGGTVTINQKQMPNRAVLGDIGYMAQSDALYEDLTARENLKFFAQIYMTKGEDIQQRIEWCAEKVNLTQDLDQLVKNFSGGMKRRLSLAMSFLQNPQILILDEPTVGIDPKLRKSVWEDLYAFKGEGKAILITTHVLDEADRCDKLLLMNNGKIVAQGTPTEIKGQYGADSIEDVFLKMGDEEK
ncbi:ABC transporter ATP-binding protein [Staphylococcus intermedius]|uniref:ABC transporter, ATP-binding protein n=1 Tax=Staphylococcus intermedius NCTC 11048 TaxID=1141106 RepID=A0A380G321_STAIN|nr:ABC transporter ATP-binding protein [Staphylococcus intermedius]PCF64128.1 glycosyl transferase family 2 [Staphylococcus intermedius]PCF78843.1 glycosyl transferase family 2 [Staphylococcus intermedius]PCF79816.1 glycosyl transferase family 2 [Staphylococcus intermedius]PCF85003.1 glycosyl transferase family 2 [Staphylococcus intermedius]PCF89525.1 glycosyl transferase family 2 [Staphylococcus intermedius]